MNKDSAAVRIFERRTVERAPRNHSLSICSVVTSLGPTPKRISATRKDYGEIWLKTCASSWKTTAPRVQSVSEIAPPLPGIEWVRVAEKPRIAELFAGMKPEDGKSVLLLNSDILISQSLRDARHSLSGDIVYYGRRVDVDYPADDGVNFIGKEYYKWGFDYFILPSAFIQKVNAERSIPDFLRVGEPWWDYAVPILALVSGFPVKRLKLKSPAAFHLKHPNVSDRYLKQNGIKFVAWLRQLNEACAHPLSSILPSWLQEENLAESDGGYLPGLATAVLQDMP